MARQMGPREYSARKHAQSRSIQTTSTLGLAGLGMLAAGHGKLASKSPKAYTALKKVPGLKKVTSPAEMNSKLKTGAFATTTTSGGIASLAGYNTAALNEQGRKKVKDISKSESFLDVPMFGEIGKAANWSPSASKFDPEGQRMKRSDAYPKIVAGASGVAGGMAAANVGQAARTLGRSKAAANKLTRGKKAGAAANAARELKVGRAAAKGQLRSAGKYGAASAALAGGAVALNHKKNSKSWSPYVSKGLGDWKSIDQRERTQTRNRKTMRSAAAVGGLGATVGALGYADPHEMKNAKKTVKSFKRVNNGLKDMKGLVNNKQKARALGEVAVHGAKGSPKMAIGAGVVGAAAAVGAGAKAQHTYQQHKVNQRRRANYKASIKKSAFGVEHD